jgi:hypothetical protein
MSETSSGERFPASISMTPFCSKSHCTTQTADLPPFFVKGSAYFRSRAVAVVGRRFDHGPTPAWRVALVHDALELRAVGAAGGSLDRPLDIQCGMFTARARSSRRSGSSSGSPPPSRAAS